MTPEWVDYLGAFSAAGAMVLAALALVFAVKAGRDLTHDRRDTFEIGIFREMLAQLDREHVGWPPDWMGQMQTLRNLITADLPQVERMLARFPQLGITYREEDPHAADNKMREREQILASVRSEINAAVRARTGQS